ncbi:unnamed protein product [Cyprideis torosa]|uniref:Uncharacterized protein n=1 Tax=Cyprideis torosa TaxID=163714 RepID=A0A7R8WIT5_9CRUS|nr:unnamed protein product [Cyprideis torosa]CAG0898346.1 unnamed protein product [Cyprideis torosa]
MASTLPSSTSTVSLVTEFANASTTSLPSSTSASTILTTLAPAVNKTTTASSTIVFPTSTASPTSSITTESPFIEDVHFCKVVLYSEINGTRIRYWDLLILIPNVLSNLGISILRCIISMAVNATVPAGEVVDKVLWVAVRFFLLATELSVLTFGLAFGHLDSRTSIRRVLMCTASISLAFSITQGLLEVLTPDEAFHVAVKNYNMFGHGGMTFWCISSVLFTLIYGTVFLLPYTPLRERLSLPSRQAFYYYVLFLALLNLLQAFGAGVLIRQLQGGLCLVDITTFSYFIALTPLVYWTFLRDFLRSSQQPLFFSYKPQFDEGEDEVPLPNQHYSPSGDMNRSPQGTSCNTPGMSPMAFSAYSNTSLDHPTQVFVAGSPPSPQLPPSRILRLEGGPINL